jgi:hypothetical protein
MSTFPDLGMAITMRQERFGDSFLLAVAAAAGCACAKPETDNDSIDWTLSCRLSRMPKIDVQIKTLMTNDGLGDHISYALKKKNYDDLILSDIFSPRILVVAAIPEAIELWLECSEEQLILRRSAYWVCLAGHPKSDNQTTVNVQVPKSQPFDVPHLREMMRKVNEEGGI